MFTDNHRQIEDIEGNAPINGLPQDGGSGNPGEIWHFQVFKCQFPHLWVTIISQIPTPGATNCNSCSHKFIV